MRKMILKSISVTVAISFLWLQLCWADPEVMSILQKEPQKDDFISLEKMQSQKQSQESEFDRLKLLQDNLNNPKVVLTDTKGTKLNFTNGTLDSIITKDGIKLTQVQLDEKGNLKNGIVTLPDGTLIYYVNGFVEKEVSKDDKTTFYTYKRDSFGSIEYIKSTNDEKTRHYDKDGAIIKSIYKDGTVIEYINGFIDKITENDATFLYYSVANKKEDNQDLTINYLSAISKDGKVVLYNEEGKVITTLMDDLAKIYLSHQKDFKDSSNNITNLISTIGQMKESINNSVKDAKDRLSLINSRISDIENRVSQIEIQEAQIQKKSEGLGLRLEELEQLLKEVDEQYQMQKEIADAILIKKDEIEKMILERKTLLEDALRQRDLCQKQYEAIKKELEEALKNDAANTQKINWLQNNLSTLKVSLDQMSSSKEDMECLLKQLKTEKVKVDSEFYKAQNNVNAAQRAYLQVKQTTYFKSWGRVDTKKKQEAMAKAEENIKIAQDKFKNASIRKNQIDSKIKQLQNNLAGCSQNRNNVLQQYNQAKAQLETALRISEDNKEKIAALQAKLAGVEKELNLANIEVHRLESELGLLIQENNQVGDEYAKAVEELKQIGVKREAIENEIYKTSEELSIVLNSIDELAKEKEDLGAELTNLKDSKEVVLADVSKFTKDVDELSMLYDKFTAIKLDNSVTESTLSESQTLLYEDSTLSQYQLYDSNLKLLKTKRMDGVVINYKDGLIKEVISKDGKVLSSYEYSIDSTLGITGIDITKDNLIASYDSEGNILGVKTNELIFNIDKDRLSSIVRPDGAIITDFKVDSFGSIIDADVLLKDGDKTIYKDGVLKYVTSAQGDTVEYDNDGKVSALSMQDGRVYTYTYEKDAKVVTLTNTDNFKDNFQIASKLKYDLNDNLIWIERMDGSAITYKDGNIDRIIAKDGVRQYSYEKDQNGNIIKTIVDDGKIAKYYNWAGNLDKIETATSSDNPISIDYKYNKVRKIAKENTSYLYSYEFDKDGNEITIIEDPVSNQMKKFKDDKLIFVKEANGITKDFEYKDGKICKSSMRWKTFTISSYEYSYEDDYTIIKDDSAITRTFDKENRLTFLETATGLGYRYIYVDTEDEGIIQRAELSYIKLADKKVLYEDVKVNNIEIDSNIATIIEYDKEGGLIAVEKADGTIANYDDGRVTSVMDQKGNVLVAYEYDEEDNPISIYMIDTRDKLYKALDDARAEVAKRKSQALEELSRQKSLAYQSIQNQLNNGLYEIEKEKQRLLSLAQDIDSIKVAGKKARSQKYDALHQIQAGLISLDGQASSLYSQANSAYQQLDKQVQEVGEKIDKDENITFEQLLKESVSFDREILKQEVTPIVYHFYRNILGRDPDTDELNTWLDKTKDMDPFDKEARDALTAEIELKTTQIKLEKELAISDIDSKKEQLQADINRLQEELEWLKGKQAQSTYMPYMHRFIKEYSTGYSEFQGRYGWYYGGIEGPVYIGQHGGENNSSSFFNVGGFITNVWRYIDKDGRGHRLLLPESFNPWLNEAEKEVDDLRSKQKDLERSKGAVLEKERQMLKNLERFETLREKEILKKEIENWMSGVKEQSKVNIDELKDTLLGDEYKLRKDQVDTIKSNINKILAEYINGPDVKKEAVLKNLGLTKEEIIELSKDDVQRITEYINSRGMHFGHSAFLALKELLNPYNLILTTEEIATNVILIDILTGVINPSATGDLELSMYAMTKYAQARGVDLVSAKISYEDLVNIYQTTNDESRTTKLIAHINGNHYVVVTNVTDVEVTYFEPNMGPNGQSFTISKEEFLKVWQGYTVVHEDEIRTTDDGRLSKEQAQKITGSFFPWFIPLITSFLSTVLSFIDNSVCQTISKVLGIVSLGMVGVNLITNIASNLIGAFKTGISNFGQAITTGIKAVGEGLLEGFKSLGPKIALFSSNLANNIFNTISGISYSISLSKGFEKLGVNTTVSNILSSMLTGGITSPFSWVSAGKTIGDLTLNNVLGNSLTYGTISGMTEIGSHAGLDKTLTGIIGITAGSIVNAGMGGITIDGTTYTGLTAISKSLGTNILPNLAGEFAYYGITKLGEALGLDPRISQLAGIPVSATISGIFANDKLQNPNDKTNSLLNSITQGLLKGVTSVALEFGFESAGLEAWQGALIGRTITSGLEGIFTGNYTKGLTDSLKNTLTLSLADKDYNELSYWDKSVYISKVIDFSQIAKEKGIGNALETYATSIFSRDTIENIYKQGGILDLITKNAVITTNQTKNIPVKRVYTNQGKTDYFDLSLTNEDLISIKQGNIYENCKWVIGPDGKPLIKDGTQYITNSDGSKTVLTISNLKIVYIEKLDKDGKTTGYVMREDGTTQILLGKNGNVIQGKELDLSDGYEVSMHDGQVREIVSNFGSQLTQDDINLFTQKFNVTAEYLKDIRIIYRKNDDNSYSEVIESSQMSKFSTNIMDYVNTFNEFIGLSNYMPRVEMDPYTLVSIVDMPLEYYHLSGALNEKLLGAAEIYSLLLGRNVANEVWSKATTAAAPYIVNQLKLGSGFVYVPGINDSTTTLADINMMSSLINDTEQIAFAHSAGTEALLKAAILAKQQGVDLSKTKFIFASPRMNVQIFELLINEAGIRPDQVLVVTSKGDLPHWPNTSFSIADLLTNPLQPYKNIINITNDSFTDYETNKSWTYVYLEEDISHKNDPINIEKMLDHTGMIDGLLKDHVYYANINGNLVKDITLKEIYKSYPNSGDKR